MFKQVSDWIEIEYVEDEHEEANDFKASFWYNFKASFWYNNRRYFLENFIRCHNNPWGGMNVPDYIHGYESGEYYRPLFIELSNDGEMVKVYMEVN